MNITHLFQWGWGAVVVAACGSLMAQGEANAPETGARTAAVLAPAQLAPPVDEHAVSSELAKLTYFNGVQPNLDAKFYIYLCSASWCSPCRAEMPQIVKDYAEMKELGVEVVMLSCDHEKEKAVQFMKDFNAPFPGAWGQNYKYLPGLIAGIKLHGPMVPYAIIVTNTGKIVAANIAAGPDGVMTHWKDYVTGKMTDPMVIESAQPAPAKEQDGSKGEGAAPQADTSTQVVEGHAVANQLRKLNFFNAQPNTEARYYIYLYSASWCPPCRAEMPKIVADYAEMKEKGVEIVLLGCDRTREKAEAYLKNFKAPFAGIMVEEGGNLPGFVRPDGIPYAVIVKNTGEVLVSNYASGSRGVIAHWREYIAKDHAGDDVLRPQR